MGPGNASEPSDKYLTKNEQNREEKKRERKKNRILISEFKHSLTVEGRPLIIISPVIKDNFCGLPRAEVGKMI